MARFPSGVAVEGAATPDVSGKFEVEVDGAVVHSKKGGDGFIDTEEKLAATLAKIAARCKEAGHAVKVDDQADVAHLARDTDTTVQTLVLFIVGFLLVKVGWPLLQQLRG
eukprot:g8149.t1